MYVSLSKENSVAVVDATTGDVLKKIPVGQTPEQIELSQDGRWVFTGNTAEGTVSIVDPEHGVVTATIPVGRGAYGVQFVGTLASPLSSLSKNSFGYAEISVLSR